MPSEKILEQKKAIVENLVEQLNGACAGVLVNYKGITVEDDTKLRKQLREAGVEYSVVKNTLLKRAAAQVGYSDLNDVLEGTTAIAISKTDEIAAAKILCKFAKDSTTGFEVKKGFAEGKVLSKEEVENLAKLPSKEVLLAQLLCALNGNLTKLAQLLNAIIEKDSEGAAPAEEAPAAE